MRDFKHNMIVFGLGTVIAFIAVAAQIGFWVGMYMLLFKGTFCWYLPAGLAVTTIWGAVKTYYKT